MDNSIALLNELDTNYMTIGKYIAHLNIYHLLTLQDKIGASNIASALSTEYKYKIKKKDNWIYPGSTKAYHLNILELTFDRYNLIRLSTCIKNANEKVRTNIVKALQQINALPMIINYDDLFIDSVANCVNGRIECLSYCLEHCGSGCSGKEEAVQKYIDFYTEYRPEEYDNYEDYENCEFHQDFLLFINKTFKQGK